LILLSDNLSLIQADNGFVLSRILMATHMFNSSITTLTAVATLVASLFALPSAWAYKVEKICEDIPATSTGPAQKKCKVVRVVEGGSAKAGADGKGDGKADGHGDAKKDAKPAGGH
jgi:hypothetical protein